MRTRPAAAALLTSLSALAFLAIAPVPTGAQEPIDRATIARIREEGTARSSIPMIFDALTNVLGQRLAGSPSYDAAAAWARDRFTGWQLSNVRLEPFPMGRGWSLEKQTIELVSPRYMPLNGYAEAWTPSTAGVVTGAPVYVGDKTAEQIDALAGRLRGAIALTHLPQAEFFRQDRPQPAASEASVRTGNPPGIPTRSTTPQNQMGPRLLSAGAALLLRPSSGEHGTVFVQGSRNTADGAVPSIVLQAEHYNMIVRLMESGAPVQLRVELATRYHPNTTDDNIIAEIPGTDPALRDQIVLIGAHLDSWHSSTGATDNADGAASAMEAIRILKALNLQPRRTIRVAIWGAEEQGLLGARAYVERYLADQAGKDRHAVFLNDDPGSGATFGFYMEQNPQAKTIFDAWLGALGDQGVRRNVIEGIGSTDHVPFVQVGVPAFTAIKNFAGYDSRSRHGNADFFERTALDDLKQSAIVLATFAWHAAQRDQPIPRQPPPLPDRR